MSERIFYCPIHGRTTEPEFMREKRKRSKCRHCDQWFHQKPKVTAKRFGES